MPRYSFFSWPARNTQLSWWRFEYSAILCCRCVVLYMNTAQVVTGHGSIFADLCDFHISWPLKSGLRFHFKIHCSQMVDFLRCQSSLVGHGHGCTTVLGLSSTFSLGYEAHSLHSPPDAAAVQYILAASLTL